MSRMLCVGVVGSAIAVAALAAGACGGSSAEPADAAGKVAFVTHRGSSSAIYVINADGTGRRQLTRPRSPHTSWGPVAWSPSGRRIAYSGRLRRNTGGYADLYIVNADGSGTRRLKAFPREDDQNPSWSPDGTKLAFDRQGDGLNWIYVTNVDGTGLRQLTQVGNWYPRWLPDGRIAFVNGRGVWVMSGDGSKKRLVARVSLFIDGDAHPSPASWSPDGRRIAYTTGVALWVMNADGTKRRKLFGDPKRRTGYPAWSPDGRRLAFTQGDGDPEIFVVNADGTVLRNLTDNEFDDSEPAWSSDGRAIAFVSERDGNTDIYVMNAGGRGERNLSNSPGWDSGPVWSP